MELSLVDFAHVLMAYLKHLKLIFRCILPKQLQMRSDWLQLPGPPVAPV